MKIENQSRKPSLELDRIGVGKIERLQILPIPLVNSMLKTWKLVKARLFEMPEEAHETINHNAISRAPDFNNLVSTWTQVMELQLNGLAVTRSYRLYDFFVVKWFRGWHVGIVAVDFDFGPIASLWKKLIDYWNFTVHRFTGLLGTNTMTGSQLAC